MRRWRSASRARPERLVSAGPGQESVWDYPRPPRIEPVTLPVRIEFAGRVIALSQAALRVVETASPPTYYLPRADVGDYLEPAPGQSLCEWKGLARYESIRVGDRTAECAVWSYPDPLPGFEALRDNAAFFPARVDACYVGNERVRPQPGLFYGGWITANLVGPFKGDPGSESW